MDAPQFAAHPPDGADAREMRDYVPFLPPRTRKPRAAGVTMVMDKGLGVRAAEDLCETAAPHIDLLKLGFGSAVFTGRLRDKLAVYRRHGVDVYVGGTLLEAFYARGRMADFHALLGAFGIGTVEVSDGSWEIAPDEKAALIRDCRARGYRVVSEVGNKCKARDLTAEEWVAAMRRELDAGAELVIAEARESGTTGIFRADGSVDAGLVGLLAREVGADRILWEAPRKSQQHWLIREFGVNVNLGNVAPGDVVGLEALRNGLRGDTLVQVLEMEK